MSKSNSSSRSNSTETPAAENETTTTTTAGANNSNSTQQQNGGCAGGHPAAILETAESNGHLHQQQSDRDENSVNGNATNGRIIPSSPPPSYEYVLEETRLQARQQDASSPVKPLKGPEIMHKSSKQLYKAVAKQWGITCKMSDGCRCFDCQSHYFDCEYEQNEQEKTDGGLGAGTPMFLQEVMHSSGCSIL